MMRCSMVLDVAMLRWIVYIKSLDPDIWYISGKDNAMVDMLSRAQFIDEVAESEEGEVSEYYFASEHVHRVPAICEVRENEYEGETLRTRRMLQGGDKDLKLGGDIR